MSFNLAKTIAAAASAGLMVGAVAACSSQSGQHKGARSPHSSDAEASAQAKNCCKGQNECKAKGQCATAAHDCAGMNACKGQGGCNNHCPK